MPMKRNKTSAGKTKKKRNSMSAGTKAKIA